MNSDKENDSVQVAVRIRPLVVSEISRGCQDILEVFTDINQIRIKDSDKAFTFNHVCDTLTSQDTFYDTCVKHLVSNLFKGYNVTILAYGQTGSGKTYSMGTAYEDNEQIGIIPRAVHDIFNYVNDNFSCDFNITVSFMELYQETLYDLLASKPREQCVLEIREDPKGLIVIPGLTAEPVTSASKTLEYLCKGSRGRVTGCTNMNAQSSRSHAIFTINICMQQKNDSANNKTAKFYLVDLAGSERSKKTGATGVVFREGVNINKGLLALGNVISVLGGDKQQSYICYRDSNLTRLLKDSLGGNSITLMIACVSPADYNLDETISTLRYADRARKIKNKPVVNQDPKVAEINRLNKLVTQLRLELIGQGGPIICQSELDRLKKDYEIVKVKNRDLTQRLSSTLTDNTSLFERVMILQSANERVMDKLSLLREEYNAIVGNLNTSLDTNALDAVKEQVEKLQNIQSLFNELFVESQKNEEEIRKHERCSSNTNAERVDLVTSETEFCERQETHTKQQLALNNELQEVTKMLAMKEYLAQQMVANTNHIVDYNAITENEKKIECLEKERNDLMQQLKNIQNHGTGNKLAEQRRKRVQELEKEIQDLHKKVTEQSKMIKLKEKDELKIKILNNEIQQMKSIKVKLIKTMKQELEKFRTWKLQRERELVKLKEQDRKRLNQMVKMETIHNRQQNVLKRKVEEAAAVNKRLKDALALRKNVQEQKNSGKIEKMENWLKHEFDLLISTVDAECTLLHLLEDRAMLQNQLDNLKDSPNLEESMEIKQLEEDIDLRSTQIQDLQQKILDSDQENKSKTRFDNIQTMAEAKVALKFIFDLTSDIRRREIQSGNKCSELQTGYEELKLRCDSLEAQIKALKANHQHELSDIIKECEEKVSVLLRQLRRLPMEDIKEEYQQRYVIQQLALEKSEEAVEELKDKLKTFEEQMEHNENKLKSENDDLRRLLDEIKSNVFDCDISVEDNVELDPDWRNTPLAKRVQKIRDSTVTETRCTIKRSFDGGCTCRRGRCITKSCGCKKLGSFCNALCKCSNVCENNDKETKITEDEIVIDDFKKPRPEEMNLNFRSSRRRKGLNALFSN
ncbi:hypothetical protein RN001_000675 [Aquatica leii]|uniref:Kinesin motor domain-containing protein n=1 Tax=Aquatica leii TaxID=1421715 RepID=A0AAN7Q389_9COLE|nr:hypothetical protein RN001_000675 [Aquatica leii]